MSEVERIGKFIYFYDGDTTVVAYLTTSFKKEGRELVEKKVGAIAKRTGEYYEVVYNGETYQGVAFNAISELLLVWTLSH